MLNFLKSFLKSALYFLLLLSLSVAGVLAFGAHPVFCMCALIGGGTLVCVIESYLTRGK